MAVKNDPLLHSYCRFRLLEYATNLIEIDTNTAAELLGITHGAGPYTERELASVEWNRVFESAFRRGRANYAVLVKLGEVAVAHGEWAFVEEVEDALPGYRLPARLWRRGYLLNLHRDQFGSALCVDVHSLTFLPLIRCHLNPMPAIQCQLGRVRQEVADVNLSVCFARLSYSLSKPLAS